MAFLAAVLPYVGTILGAAGAVASGVQARDAGKKQKSLDYMQAEMLEQQAIDTNAVAQHRARDERERAGLLVSRAQALAAAGGGTATDASVMNVIADIEGEGALRAAMALYEGENEAKGLTNDAMFTRMGGDMAEKAGKQRSSGYYTQAAGYIGQGYTTYYNRYGSKNKPSSGTGTD